MAGEAIVAIDEAHAVILFNRAAELIFGYQASEVLGQPVDRLIPPRFRESHRRGVARFAAQASDVEHRSRRTRVIGLRKDGREFRAEASISKVDYAWGTTFITVMRDVTEQERLESELREREQQYHSVFESVSDGLFINTIDGELVDFNPAAAQMHGYTVEEFKRLQPTDFIHPDYFHVYDDYRATVQAGRDFQARAVDVRKDGAEFPVEVHGTSFSYRGQVHTLALVRDITDQVEARRLLEQRVEERTRELQTLFETVQRGSERFRAISELGQHINAILDVEELIARAVRLIQDTFGYYHVHIGLIDGDILHLPAHAGVWEDEAVCNYCATLQLRLDQDAICSRVASSGEPLLVADIGREPHYLHPMGATGSGVVVPLQVKGKIIGLLDVESRQVNAFDELDVAVLQLLANQVAVAIENGRLYTQAQTLAALQERQRLARELHDSVSQALYGIGLGTRTALQILEHSALDASQAETLRQPLEYTMSLTESALAEMRALIFELRPESLQTEGLIPALTRRIDALRARQEIEVETTLSEEPTLSVENKEVLYRVASEALHNVIKHARARRVTVSLVNANGDVTLHIGDDGVGFDPEGNFPGHLGLQSMRERVERAGGAFTLQSTPGVGTTVQAILKSIPVAHAAASA